MGRNYWQSERIRIRGLEESDLQYFLEERKNPDSIRQYFEDFIEPPSSERDIRNDYEKTLEEFNKEDKRIFIIENFDHQYMGQISIWHTNRRSGLLRYGIFIEESYRGKGYAKEALVIVLDYYFNELNYHKAGPMVYAFNQNSQQFHEKFGFLKEGVIRHELYTRGQYHDLIYYGMLQEEFNQKHRHPFPGK